MNLRRASVLVACNSEILRMTIARLLRWRGFEAAEMVRPLPSTVPAVRSIDAILVDESPSPFAIDLVRQVRGRQPEVVVLVMGPDGRVRGLDGETLKPGWITGETLIEALRRVSLCSQ